MRTPSKTQYILFKLYLSTLRLCSLSVCQVIGTWVGYWLCFKTNRLKQTTEANITHCFPELNDQQRQQLTQQSLIETGKCLVEMPKIWVTPFQQCTRWLQQISGEPLFFDALTADTGLLLLAPHLGNWEMINHYLVQHTQVVAMYKPSQNPILERLILNARNQSNTRMVPANAKGIKALLTCLKSGGVAVILPDQEPQPPSGTFASFFNLPAYTSVLAAKLIQRSHCQVLCLFAKRLTKAQGFDICFRPVLPVLLTSERLEERIEALNCSVEQCVRECASQYQWEYKRFKQRPPDHPSIYS